MVKLLTNFKIVICINKKFTQNCESTSNYRYEYCMCTNLSKLKRHLLVSIAYITALKLRGRTVVSMNFEWSEFLTMDGSWTRV